MLPIKTILHPTDFSDASAHALKMAAMLARDYSARLILLHAMEPPIYYGELGVSFSAPESYRESALDRVAALVHSLAPLNAEPLLLDGVAAPEILRVAKEEHADMIVLGSHGRTGIGRVLMGSVAEEIARKAPCPVLIVRTPHEIPREEPSASAVAVAVH